MAIVIGAMDPATHRKEPPARWPRSLGGAVLIGILAVAFGYWLGITRIPDPTVAAGTFTPVPSVTATALPTKTPIPSLSPTMTEFVSKYVAVRQKYWDAVFAVFAPISEDPKAWIAFYGQESGVRLRFRNDFEDLPRTPETRQFIEDALRALQAELSADILIGDAYKFRGELSTAETTQWFAMKADAARLWRTLDDSIEDVLARYDASWPGGRRPLSPE